MNSSRSLRAARRVPDRRRFGIFRSSAHCLLKICCRGPRHHVAVVVSAGCWQDARLKTRKIAAAFSAFAASRIHGPVTKRVRNKLQSSRAFSKYAAEGAREGYALARDNNLHRAGRGTSREQWPDVEATRRPAGSSREIIGGVFRDVYDGSDATSF